ncbi:MAG: hypothetical protein JOZ41_16555 [Chloroflexi bacterium]|nr:hypothetical protein [Chloroflexota bacterium]
MSAEYAVIRLSDAERERLERAYDDLMALSTCEVPAVRAAARAAVAHVAQALNGEGLAYRLYSKDWQD